MSILDPNDIYKLILSSYMLQLLEWKINFLNVFRLPFFSINVWHHRNIAKENSFMGKCKLNNTESHATYKEVDKVDTFP